MQIDKKTILAFVLGVIVAGILVHGYTVYQVRQLAYSNQATIAEIINFLNVQMEQQPGVIPEEGDVDMMPIEE